MSHEIYCFYLVNKLFIFKINTNRTDKRPENANVTQNPKNSHNVSFRVLLSSSDLYYKIKSIDIKLF